MRGCGAHARRDLFCLKMCVLTAYMPAGAFFCLKKFVLTAHMPAGAFFGLKKSALTAYMPAPRPQTPDPGAWERPGTAKVAFRVHETLVLHTPPDPANPPDPPDRRSELRLRPSLPHAPGARITGVKQTPSNENKSCRWGMKTGYENRLGIPV